MKLSQSTLALFLALACAANGAQARSAGVPLLGPSLDGASVFAAAYASTGANSTVVGNILSGGIATTGAHALVNGGIVSIGAANIGGGAAAVTGSLVSGGVATMGAGAVLGGNLLSAGAASIGANALVRGNMLSNGAATTGDASWVGGDVRSGGAATIGANATVVGKVQAVGAITLSASSTTHGTGALAAQPLVGAIRTNVQAESQQVGAAQAALKNMRQGSALGSTMTLDTTLYPGVFTAASLSTTAGITLTLDGQNGRNQAWVFNIDDYLVTGAAMKIVLINADASNSVIWNSGGYASLGAGGTFIGTILAQDYISVGAGTSVTGVGSACGGVISATSYVSTGDGARIGGNGCSGTGSGFEIVDGTAVRIGNLQAVPEPSTCAMLVAGLALLGVMRQRKRARQ